MNPHIDITGKEIRTERLLLRPFTIDDVDDVFEYASVDCVGQAAGWLPHTIREESEIAVKEFIEGKRAFAITLCGKVIGSFEIEYYPEKNYPEFEEESGAMLGFVLSKDWWGRGLMPEAVGAVMDFLFAEYDLDFILAGYFDWNLQSKRVMEKCGLRPYRKVSFFAGTGRREHAVDCIIMRDDWKKENR